MAKAARKAEGTTSDSSVSKAAYWREQIAKQERAYLDFQTGGDRVIDRYRIEKANAQVASLQDRYNILYSSTETMRPSLYAQAPKVEIAKRHRDRKNPIVQQAVNLLETTVAYAVDEIDFDEVMESVVEDYLLPGLGFAWVRYEPVFKDQIDGNGKAVNDNEGKPAQVIDAENIGLDYVSWKDALFGPCRTWRELPWAAKRVYMTKAKVAKRFSLAVANSLNYTDNAADKNNSRSPIVEDKQATIWEIWDKDSRTVIWIADGYDRVLDEKDDPLKLKKFWPFPKPMRAISNTRTFVPRPFYSQYQSQAEELDNITGRIRHLTNALNVRGVFDGSVTELQALLSPKGGNKMIPVPNWHQFKGQSGVEGAIEWVPIDKIVQVLMELYKAREAAKAEIYEITGFSDIVRGLSKASETLGAQQIKQDWAGGRLRIMQKEVQRFCRDLVRIIAEIASEHFTDETFALYSGFEVPPAPPQPMPVPGQPMPLPQPDPAQIAVQEFKAALDLLRKERERCASIDIETDSTILPDEEGERKDRLEFLGQIGAFLQQAAPTVQQFPHMAGLLGAMMMFSVRTFRAARPIEQEFERFQQALEANPPPPPNDGKADAAAKAQSALQVAQTREQGATQRQAADLAHKASESDKDRGLEQQKLAADAAAAQVTLQVKQTELRIKEAELAIKQAELGLKQQQGAIAAEDAVHDRSLEAQDQEHQHAMDRAGSEQAAYEFEATGQRQDEQAAEAGDREDRQFEAEQKNPQKTQPGG